MIQQKWKEGRARERRKEKADTSGKENERKGDKREARTEPGCASREASL